MTGGSREGEGSAGEGEGKRVALAGIPKEMPSSQYTFDEIYLLPALLGVCGNVVSFVVVYKRNLSLGSYSCFIAAN